MKPIYFFIFLFLITSLTIINAQKVTTNDRGERIVEFPDGSWRYYIPADSVLLEENKKNKAASKENASSTESTDISIESNIVNHFINRLQKEIKELADQQIELTEKRLKIKEQYDKLVTGDKREKQATQILANKLSTVKSSEAKTREFKKECEKLLDDLLHVKRLSDAKKKDALLSNDINYNTVENNEDIDQLVNKYFLDRKSNIKTDISVSTTTDSPEKDPLSYNTNRKKPDLKDFNSELLSNNCKLKFQGKREYSEYRNTVLEKELLFTHTPKKTEEYFVKSDLIKCYSYFSYSKGIHSLHLIFYINSPQAKVAFGGLKKNSQLTIKTIDDETFTFHNLVSDRGTGEPGTDRTIYHGVYQMSNRDARKLEDSSLDKIRVVWSTGYEDYTIYNVDLLSRQLKCLEQFL